MAESSWSRIGCSSYNDEWACVEGIGQAKADAGFKTHWDTWTTESDIKLMADIGLNALRIPVGFWIRESLVYDDEHYPRGGLPYLDRIVGWCKKYGIYVIMDLHAAPGVQTPNEQFTGHVSEDGFIVYMALADSNDSPSPSLASTLPRTTSVRSSSSSG